MTCVRCGAALPPGAKFCGECGTAVVPASPGVAMPGAPAPLLPPLPGAPHLDAPEPPTIEVVAEGEHAGRPGRGRGWLYAVCGVLAVGVVGVVAWMLLRSDDVASGGAGSPEEVATGFAAAMSQEDLLAASMYVSPTEMPGLDDLLVIVRDAAKAQGISGLSAGEGLDVQLELEPVRVTDLADGVARVELSMSMQMEGAPAGPLGALIGDGVDVDDRDVTDGLGSALGMERRPDLYIVVVQESGKWFVSPMLTVGDYLADALDLPAADYDAAATPDDPGRTANSEEAAFDQLAEAINDRDPALAAGVLDAGEARFVRVFERAIDELIDRAPEGDLSIDDVRVEETATDRWALTAFDIRTEDEYGDDSVVQFDDGCFEADDEYGDAERLCLAELVDLTEPLDSDHVIVHTTRADGGVRLQLAATLVDDLGQLVSRVSRATLLDVFDAAVLDTPVPASTDEPTTLTFSGEPYQLIEFTVVEDRPYLVEVVGADIAPAIEFYTEASGWEWHDWTWQDRFVMAAVPEGGRVRAVVRPGSDCDDDGCRAEEGTFTIRLQRLQTIDAEPNTIVKPKLGGGTSILLAVATNDELRYEFTTDTPGVEISLADYGYVEDLPVDDDGYSTPSYGGTTVLLVTNTGDAEVTAEVTIREHDAGGGGGDPTGEGVIIDISGGSATYTFEHEPGVSGTVTVVPDGSQDVTLDIEGCDACFTDTGYGGEAESTFVTFGDGPTTEIYIGTYADIDAFGTVMLFIELD